MKKPEKENKKMKTFYIQVYDENIANEIAKRLAKAHYDSELKIIGNLRSITPLTSFYVLIESESYDTLKNEIDKIVENNDKLNASNIGPIYDENYKPIE